MMMKSGEKALRFRVERNNIMKISAIKTTIQAPLKKMFPFALGAMALASCTQPIGRIKNYCEEFDKSAVEYKECIDKCEGKFSPKGEWCPCMS